MWAKITLILKSLPIIKEIGSHISKFARTIAHEIEKYKARQVIKKALKEKNRAETAKKINDQFRNY